MSLLASVQCECGLHATIKNHTKYCLFIILFCINAKSVQCSALFLHFSSSCHACNVPNKMRECTTHSEHSLAHPKLLFTMCNNINFAKMPRKILFYFLSFLMRVLWLVVVVARLLHDGNLFIDFLVLFVFVRLFFFFFVSFYFILISGRAHTLTHSRTLTCMQFGWVVLFPLVFRAIIDSVCANCTSTSPLYIGECARASASAQTRTIVSIYTLRFVHSLLHSLSHKCATKG